MDSTDRCPRTVPPPLPGPCSVSSVAPDFASCPDRSVRGIQPDSPTADGRSRRRCGLDRTQQDARISSHRGYDPCGLTGMLISSWHWGGMRKCPAPAGQWHREIFFDHLLRLSASCSLIFNAGSEKNAAVWTRGEGFRSTLPSSRDSRSPFDLDMVSARSRPQTMNDRPKSWRPAIHCSLHTSFPTAA
nr:hypothetical protein CFP56_46680 [Quercus suber]